ncbi:hypothetical protein OIE69_44015 (plasmid) [Actinacidiphila glaucinigra]|uniref:hypothetical protein n=1 Tax=Actinacidiphila glaucinigra TaxID=235986 RepID=UPI002DDA6BA5|nr:hypothetical protein [Actinacidiphila glaucinigra]WSD65872.1 hypothetical protein OIE69_44015 [Actinacidiphila glaucinigra]
MAEDTSPTSQGTGRFESVRDSAQQRILEAPLPGDAMKRLIQEGRASRLGDFPGSPVRFMDRWWRWEDESGWAALDEAGSSEVDRQAERYRAAVTATRRSLHQQAYTDLAPTCLVPPAGRAVL